MKNQIAALSHPVSDPTIAERQKSVERVVREDLKRIVEAIREEASALAGKTVLIAGGAGFLGRYLTAVLGQLNKDVLSEPCRVLVLDNYLTGTRANVIWNVEDDHISYLTHDISTPAPITGPVDYVIHAAGLASPIAYRRFPVEAIETAVWGAKNLLELARTKSVRSFLFFSSSEIYGDPAAEFIPTPETYRGNVSCVGPRACYDESKRLAETLCMTYQQRYDVPVKIVRPFNVFGPGLNANDGRVIPAFLMQALSGRPLRVFGAGTQTRTFCYVSDATAAFFKVLLSKPDGEVYNVGNDEEEISMVGLAHIVADLIGNGVAPQVIPYPDSYPQDEPQRRVPDLTKIRTALGYTPLVDLRTGLQWTLPWFKESETVAAAPARLEIAGPGNTPASVIQPA